MRRSILIAAVGALMLSGCVTYFPEKYQVEFDATDVPVMLNDWAIETDRTIGAEVMSRTTEANLTTISQSTETDIGGATYDVWETSTTQVSSFTTSVDAPIEYQIGTSLDGLERALFVQEIDFRSSLLFFMGVFSVDTSLLVEVGVESGGTR